MNDINLLFVMSVKRGDDQNKFIMYTFIRDILLMSVCVHAHAYV